MNNLGRRGSSPFSLFNPHTSTMFLYVLPDTMVVVNMMASKGQQIGLCHDDAWWRSTIIEPMNSDILIAVHLPAGACL